MRSCASEEEEDEEDEVEDEVESESLTSAADSGGARGRGASAVWPTAKSSRSTDEEDTGEGICAGDVMGACPVTSAEEYGGIGEEQREGVDEGDGTGEE